jgi:allantoinase
LPGFHRVRPNSAGSSLARQGWDRRQHRRQLRGGSEPSFPDGDEVSETGLTEGGGGGFEGRDLAAESMFEYGSRVGFGRVARLLSERGTAATIFGCAVALERHPEVAAAIRQLGYDIYCHGYRWRRHQSLSMERERERIAAAIVSVERTCGERPRGWYCRYGPSVNTRPLLVEEGCFYRDLDAYNDELPYWTKVAGRDHLVIPYGLATNDVKFMRGGIATGREFFDFLREAFDFLYAEVASMDDVDWAASEDRRPPTRASGLEAFIDCLAANRGVWICRRSDIASHWRTHHPSTDRALD